jgi:hypothetical protein
MAHVCYYTTIPILVVLSVFYTAVAIVFAIFPCILCELIALAMLHENIEIASKYQYLRDDIMKYATYFLYPNWIEKYKEFVYDFN